eukprot:Trichotokara_eunicae@DN5521_c0_g1_i1.p1
MIGGRSLRFTGERIYRADDVEGEGTINSDAISLEMEKRSEASFGDLDFEDVGGKTPWKNLFDGLKVPGRKHPSVGGICAVCGTESQTFCSRCSCVYYCGAEHQKENWPVHKQECKNLQR